ncbi:zinc-dependent alcohol dehydrogenase family protein [Phaeacidiphilus oryzae]|uniref:zinc-dependent alcohol dehydrogenase family protein n=1 Tax=Phaeacidiphilus oryzae TaxID=348818 RepID=UPI000566AFF2|nr:zinc-dependent alcohol dehydrogenase family protein [Phaeacidiphilus oryzae]
MRAVVIDKPGRVRVTEVPDPTPAAGQVVVEVAACGVCGTDLHILDGEFPPSPYPLIPGHEFAGTIAASDDPALPVGIRVAVDPSLYCGRCEYCRIGRGNLCADWNAVGDTVDGAFAQYVAVPATNVHRLPDSVPDFRTAAMIEPLSCAVHGVDLLGPVLGKRVLVIGSGTMGLLIAQLLGRAGASEVAVVDRAGERLTIAQALGFTSTATSVGELAGGARGFDIAVDATGAPAAIASGLDALRRGGTLLVFGVADAEAVVPVSPFRIYNDEIRILGSMAVLNSYAPAVDLIAAGAVDVAPLLGDAYPLDGYTEAVDAVRTGATGAGPKIHVLPNAEA